MAKSIVVRVPPDLVANAQAATGRKKGPAVAEWLRLAGELAERVAVAEAALVELRAAVTKLQEVRR